MVLKDLAKKVDEYMKIGHEDTRVILAADDASEYHLDVTDVYYQSGDIEISFIPHLNNTENPIEGVHCCRIKSNNIVEALLWTGDNIKDVRNFCSEVKVKIDDTKEKKFSIYINIDPIRTNDYCEIKIGEYLVKDNLGQFHICSKELYNRIFEYDESLNL